MHISLAEPRDTKHLAALLWMHAAAQEQGLQSAEAFTPDLAEWWAAHGDSHFAFIARTAPADDVVGMAWLALLPRVPRPGTTNRQSADIQSVFVVPEQRGRGFGSALIRAASEHAVLHGAGRVTVHSGRRAVPVYERLGFASSRQLLQRPPDAVR